MKTRGPEMTAPLAQRSARQLKEKIMIAKTITRGFKTYPVACAVGIVGFALYAGTASAGGCDLKDVNRDTGWSISFADAQVSNCSFVGNAGAGRNKGTLNLTLKITNKNPIPIEFIQTSSAAADSFGFRITWNLTLNNQFQTLKGIRGRARDPNEELKDDINQFVEDAHPGFAHFHQDPAFVPNPFGARDCDCESKHDFKVEGNAFLGAPSTAEVKGIGVHQIEEQGFRRSFTVNVEPRLAN
ncbi:hypothetical protein LP416_24245 [Polaromonas sp. P2-4]|nr:hypothetical protein LP416_24245 [Polaromonas sp. P2-4]